MSGGSAYAVPASANRATTAAAAASRCENASWPLLRGLLGPAVTGRSVKLAPDHEIVTRAERAVWALVSVTDTSSDSSHAPVEGGGSAAGVGGDAELPCAFVAGVGHSCPSAEAGCGVVAASSPTSASRSACSASSPPMSDHSSASVKIVLDVAQSSAVGLACLVVEHVAEPGLPRGAAAAGDQIERRHGLTGPAQQFAQVAEASSANRRGGVCGSDQPDSVRCRR